MAKSRTKSKHKKKRKHREQLRKMYGKYNKKGAKGEIPNVFEPCDAPKRPAMTKGTEYKLKWKDGTSGKNIGSKEDDKVDFEEIQKTKNFQVARKIMIQLRSSNILETLVKDKDLPSVRKFFREEAETPSQKVLDIIDEAMETCYEKVMFHQDEYNIVVDNDMREFLLNKDKAKQGLLDVILICPEFTPLMWGGESVGVPLEDEEVKPGSSEDSKEHVSPWQKAMMRARESKSGERIGSGEKSSEDSRESKKKVKKIIDSKEGKGSKEDIEQRITSGSRKRRGSKESLKSAGSGKKSKAVGSDEKIKGVGSDEKIKAGSSENAQNAGSQERIQGSQEKVKKVGSDEEVKNVGSQEKARRMSSNKKPDSADSKEKVKKISTDEKPDGTDSKENVKKIGSDEKPDSADSREKVKKISSDEKPDSAGSKEKEKHIGSDEKISSADSKEKVNKISSEEKEKKAGSGEKVEGAGSQEKLKKEGMNEKVKNVNLLESTKPKPLVRNQAGEEVDNSDEESEQKKPDAKKLKVKSKTHWLKFW